MSAGLFFQSDFVRIFSFKFLFNSPWLFIKAYHISVVHFSYGVAEVFYVALIVAGKEDCFSLAGAYLMNTC